MSRHAGFVPAARFEVASETNSFREGRDASDGDGVGGSQDAVPPPRPTDVPAAVLSGERPPPADFGDGRGGRSHLAPTHPSSDVPRWQTHLTPMQQWELRLRGAASLRDARASPERHPRNVANHPRLALQRQHEHARRLRAKDGMAQTLDLLERAARARVEGRERAISSFAKDEEERSRSVPVSPASSSNLERGLPGTTVDENRKERPDPFVSLFDAAVCGGDDETSEPSEPSEPSETRASSPRSSESELQTPFLDALVAHVTRPAPGSVLAELSAVDALWDGRSVAGESAKAANFSGSPSDSSRPLSNRNRSTRKRPQSARRFLERRLSRMRASQTSQAQARRSDLFETKGGGTRPELGSRVAPRVDSDGAPPSDLERAAAFASSAAASVAYAKDVATFRDARKEASDALAAAKALGRASLVSGETAGSDAESDEKENASGADWDRVRPSVRYVAAYETTAANRTSGDDRSPGGKEADEKRSARSSDDDANALDLPPFETLPLHFSVKDRPLYAQFDFKKLEPPPPPPGATLRASFENLGVRVDPEAFSFADAAESDAPSGGKKKRKKRRARDLAAASSVVASKMDDLMDALRVRDLTVAIQTSRRTAAERERMRDAAAKVAAAHESAAARFADTGDESELRLFDAAAATAVSECLDDVMNATRWWYGGRVRLAATTIQAGFRGMLGRKLARVRRKGLLAGLAYLRDFTRKFRFERWRENARRRRRHAMITEMQDRKRTWSRRARAFEAWRRRTQLSKRFHAEVERLARNMRVKFHQAPAFAAWRVVAARRVRQKRVGAELRRNALRRAREYAFSTWAEAAAACARARVLDTAAHARAAARAAEAFGETEAIAAAAWAAAAEAGRRARAGSFVDARRFAERARVLRDEARATCAAAERHALESGPDAGPRSRARRAYAAFAAAKESSLRADAAAAAAERAADFNHAARLFYGRAVSRRAVKAWSAHVAWVVPLREKAQKAAHFFWRSTCGSAFHVWKGEAKNAKAAREAAAIRAYADIHRRLVAKHVRDAPGAPRGVSRGVPGRGDAGAAMERRLKQLAGSVVGADRSKRPVKTGAERTRPSASGGPSAAAARAEARRAARAEEAAANKKIDVQRRAREWNSR